MILLFKISITYLFFFLSGFWISKYNKLQDSLETGVVSVLFGYSITQVLFYSIFLFSRQIGASFFLTVSILFPFILLSIWTIFKERIQINFVTLVVIGSIFFVVVLNYLWPHFWIGYGEYFLTGNGDIADNFNGMLYFHNPEKFKIDGLVNKLYQIERSVVTRGTDPAGWFLYDYVSGQYSTLAFFSILLGLTFSFDIVAIHNTFIISLFPLAILVSVRRLFKTPLVVAALVGIFSIYGNFYFSTFYNGHQGSLTMCTIGALLLFYVNKFFEDFKNINWSDYLIAITLTLIIMRVYPYPLFLLLTPFLIFMA
ncbi:MAG: hypothetical protein U0T83_04200 [Bacteriovoracaceae bacterium]